jgi:predicted DNA-binding transcriptional regulator AlpA
MQNPLKDFDSLPDSAYVRLPVVASLLGCFPSTVWRAVKTGQLPQPMRYCDRVSGWNVGQLRRLLKGAGSAE